MFLPPALAEEVMFSVTFVCLCVCVSACALVTELFKGQGHGFKVKYQGYRIKIVVRDYW